MERISQFAADLGLSGSFDQSTLVLILVFASTTLLAITLVGAFGRRDPVGRRLPQGGTAGAAGAGGLRDYGAPPKIVQAFQPAAEKLVPKSSEKVGRIRRELIQAGYLGPSAVTVYFAIKLVAAAALAGGALLLLPLIAPSLAWQQIVCSRASSFRASSWPARRPSGAS
jgi:hypothetical protein